MQEQQQKQSVKLGQRLKEGIQMARVISRTIRRDSKALGIEDGLIKSFELLTVPAQFIQMFKDRLGTVRQSAPHPQLQDIYVMGGIMIYCGILVPVLLSVGVSDFAARFAWIAFAVSFPSEVGFFLTRFLKKRNSISTYGGIHSSLASLAEIGVLATTASLFFHVWNVVGWLFLLWSLVIFIGYHCYRFGIYYKPFLSSFRDILKSLNDTPPAKWGEGEKQAT